MKDKRRKDTLKKHKAKEKKRDPYRRRVNADIGSTTSLETSSLSDLTSSDDDGASSRDSKFRKSVSRLSRRNSMRSFMEEEEEESEEIVKEDF